MSVIQGNAIESGLAAYEIPNSLRFNSADSAYLSWTPASAGNRKTWTWSGWVKRSQLGAVQGLFDAYVGGLDFVTAFFNSNDTIYFYTCSNIGSFVDYDFTTTAVFRDVSAWYHIVIVLDTSNATQANRFIVYVNGVRQAGTNPSGAFDLNVETYINSTAAHRIGSRTDGSYYSNQYMTEVNFIDGQALDPTSFGEYNSETGVWQPKEYTGSYGTNGFYLPMTQDQIVEGFNTVLWRGTGAKQKVTGVGFSPDLVWVKDRGAAQWHNLTDSVRGAGKELFTNATNAEETNGGLSSLDADGFTLINWDGANKSGDNYVGWCWDAGNSTVSNTDGTITSSVRASQTYGFSVVKWTFGTTASTVGHGLGTAPKLILSKVTSTTGNWMVYHQSVTGSNDYLQLNTTSGKQTAGSSVWGTVDSTTFGVTSQQQPAGDCVAYCFAETGYSKFGSYTGNGSSSGPTVTLGWKPSMILVKRTDSTSDWRIWDTTRTTTNPMSSVLYPNDPGAEYTASTQNIDALADGFQIKNSSASMNASGGTYIYAAFKDQREAAFWRDFSGNGNHWQPNNLDFNDSVVDVPTNYGTDTGVGAEVRGNYCTMNPLDKSSVVTLSNGNLDYSVSAGSNARGTLGTATSGLWYFEHKITSSIGLYTPITVGGCTHTGFSASSTTLSNVEQLVLFFYTDSSAWQVAKKVYNTSTTINVSGTSYPVQNDILQIAYDATNGKAWLGKNNNWIDSSGGITGNPSAGTNPTFTFTAGLSFFPALFDVGASYSGNLNAGQLPFAYAAPTGFKALCTTNLPDPAIADGSTAMNAVLYTGATPTLDINTVGFQPDLVWIKSRSSAYHGALVDSVRGVDKFLYSSLTIAEETQTSQINFDSTGFNVTGTLGNINNSGSTYVGWNWKAGGTGVSNTDGSITSTVSANTTAGFSIATFSIAASGTSDTVGHGLGVEPSMVIVKARGASSSWGVYHKSLPSAAYYLTLQTTNGQTSSNSWWNSTAPTSSVFTLGATWYGSGTMVAYCFAPVESYSAFGSFVGNGSSTDGPFIFTGFRPKFILAKKTSATSNWSILDTARDGYNVADNPLLPNSSAAESTSTSTSGAIADILSNGFKVRGNSGDINDSGATYIYAAFAENPFKYSLAR